MGKLVTIALTAAAIAAAIGFAPAAQAHSGCQSDAWGFLGGQVRSICDDPIQPDGSWHRGRIIWVPAQQVPITGGNCTGNQIYMRCSVSGGNYIPRTVIDKADYLLTADTVPPGEPPHLDNDKVI